MKHNILLCLVIYLGLTTVMFIARVSIGDCVIRYMDYLFPLTHIHCAVKQ
jgi:hypothetical protein